MRGLFTEELRGLVDCPCKSPRALCRTPWSHSNPATGSGAPLQTHANRTPLANAPQAGDVYVGGRACADQLAHWAGLAIRAG